eukprot:Colp12_sorted_trinity150504_noHs@33981
MGLFSKDKKKDKGEASKSGAAAARTEEPATEDDEDLCGKLLVRILEAKGIKPLNANTRPYCMITFSHNQILTPPATNVTGQWNFVVQFDITEVDEVVVKVLDTNSPAEKDFIGVARIEPKFKDKTMIDQWYPLVGVDGKPVGGEIRVHSSFMKQDGKKLTINDFELLKVIGKGSFGKVMQVRKKDTGRIYAMKILKKSTLVQRDEVQHTKSERKILAKNTNPFLVGLKYSFHNAEKVYLVLDYVNGGELFFHLQNEQMFDEERARFYAAQLLLAIDHLHRNDIVYRDLKPENILVDYDGYIALTDFGLCKENVKHDETTNTFCGTPEYMAPEVLQQKGYGPPVDWWTLGVLIYEMLAGIPPFYDENTNAMYQKILYGELVFPDHMSGKARDLLTQLLDRDPKKRLGSGKDGALDIKKHDWFKGINWDLLLQKKIKPTWRPKLDSKLDTSNFDSEFTSMVAQDSLVEDSHLSQTMQNQFSGFTFVDNNEFLG